MKDSEYVNIDELILTWFAWVIALFEWVNVALVYQLSIIPFSIKSMLRTNVILQ